MNGGFEAIDYLIFLGYAVLILFVGLWVSREKDGKEKNAEDYFLASKSLPWWAIGASLIAANISAEQFIGMSGSGFALGLAIASYEWMAALTLIIVGKYFLPIFIEKGLYTIPEFVEKRFSTNLKSILAVFWIALYVFVNLASVLYLGALALETIMGIPMIYGVMGLALFAAAYSLFHRLINTKNRQRSVSDAMRLFLRVADHRESKALSMHYMACSWTLRLSILLLFPASTAKI